MMVNNPVVSSIRSRQTGQVGSSISEGVGGARGLLEREAVDRELVWPVRFAVVDCVRLRSPESVASAVTACISTVFTKTTWQVSG